MGWAPGAKLAASVGGFNNGNPNAKVLTRDEIEVSKTLLPNETAGSAPTTHDSVDEANVFSHLQPKRPKPLRIPATVPLHPPTLPQTTISTGNKGDTDREGAKPSNTDDPLFVLLVKPGYGKPVLVEASRRDFPNFGGISCEPCAYTKTTLERGPLKLTTAYRFGGSSMASIDRVGGGSPETFIVIADNVGDNVGSISSSMNRGNGAIGVLNEVVRLAPNLPDPYHTLGLVYNAFEQGNIGQAWYCLSKAINADPADITLRYHRASRYMEIGNYEKAGSPLKLQFESNDANTVVSCVEIGSNFDVWNSNVLGLDVELSVGKIVIWGLEEKQQSARSGTQVVVAIKKLNQKSLQGFEEW
ncbi:hypothetical protein Nepgr_024642 [Nepenthes gracilis]|uniref:Uncharacterized protein n=1 Tax=Nepenthes gracilis TaxID=150966 RepID=A0AAD3Y082_NEPGR|nr:hypothetical protein Nepgr_024642 [Nepenthes gracilis]